MATLVLFSEISVIPSLCSLC